MIHINILSRSDRPFFPHWDMEMFPPSEFDIRENSDEDIVWDCVVVYQNIPREMHFNCRSGNLFYFSGEPPMMFPCPSVFLKQFDKVILPHPNVRHKNKVQSHGYLNWSLGYGYYSHTHKYNYQQLKRLEPPKNKLFSVVSSNQKMMPGHNKRMNIIEKLQRDYPGIVDIYGRGFNTVDYKADALEPYLFHICMENSSLPDYWTEKLSDPILAQCVPIYAGCSNISYYLGEDGIIQFDINDYKGLRSIIDRILTDPEGFYNKYKFALEKVRKQLMEKQNLIPFVIGMVKKQDGEYDSLEYCIKPLDSSWQYTLQLWIIRFKRFIINRWLNLRHK